MPKDKRAKFGLAVFERKRGWRLTSVRLLEDVPAAYHRYALSGEEKNKIAGHFVYPKRKALCPICGVSIHIVGITVEGRLIGSCKDAFTSATWWGFSTDYEKKPKGFSL